ncbi:MAG TPA: helix-turn-helix transcriptional regulator [Solirubrobacteraceae bacterium]|jgi:transcriptional regulator with XRE-family HTH domain
MATATANGAPVGEMLRTWRRRRSLSQLELALDAEVSSRHVSFLETGRSTPSREMLLHLAEHLAVPLRERNSLLLAAGYAPVYGEHSLSEQEMEPVRQALERFLRAHEPYPALVLDRHFDLLSANDALGLIVAGVAPELLQPPANTLRLTMHPHGMAPRIVNFGEWSGHLLARLRRQAASTADPQLDELFEELRGYPGVGGSDPGEQAPGTEICLPLRLRDGEAELSFLSTISTFGTAADVTLSELSIEAFYPADTRTAARLLEGIGATLS